MTIKIFNWEKMHSVLLDKLGREPTMLDVEVELMSLVKEKEKLESTIADLDREWDSLDGQSYPGVEKKKDLIAKQMQSNQAKLKLVNILLAVT